MHQRDLKDSIRRLSKTLEIVSPDGQPGLDVLGLKVVGHGGRPRDAANGDGKESSWRWLPDTPKTMSNPVFTRSQR
jgi:hypothetical protein